MTVKRGHREEVPEHPVIWAMERYGEYPVPERRNRECKMQNWAAQCKMQNAECRIVVSAVADD